MEARLSKTEHTYNSRFAIGDRVHIDDDNSITARVVGLRFLSTGHDVEVAWISNGDFKDIWLDAWRLSPAGEQ